MRKTREATKMRQWREEKGMNIVDCQCEKRGRSVFSGLFLTSDISHLYTDSRFLLTINEEIRNC